MIQAEPSRGQAAVGGPLSLETPSGIKTTL